MKRISRSNTPANWEMQRISRPNTTPDSRMERIGVTLFSLEYSVCSNADRACRMSLHEVLVMADQDHGLRQGAEHVVQPLL